MFQLIGFTMLAVLAVGGRAAGFGTAGHESVGFLAAHYLTGSRAEREVKALLKENEGLNRAATWADRAKLPEKYLNPEMKEFVANNPDHHSFHYCDVPFQQKSYRLGLTGTNGKDIVQTLKTCIAVLQKPEDDGGNPLKINKRIALMLVAHYIGDLHQPLHVGCSYVDDKDQFVDPETGAKGQGDRGANCFLLTTKTSLHGYWDTQTVKLARDHAGSEDFTAYLLSHFPKQPEWEANGDVATWPEQWATDSLGFSKQCFDGITLGPRILLPADEKHEAMFNWKIKLPVGYDVKARDIIEVQLSKSGYRLAMLLKAVWPEKSE